MKIKLFAAVGLLLAASPSFAGPCTSTVNWGSLGPPGLENFGNFFSSPGSYSDCYAFTLDEAADGFGGLIAVDPLFDKLDINVTSVSLSGGGLAAPVYDFSAGTFSFASLLAGTYQFAVNVDVTRDSGLWNLPVSYFGAIGTFASAAQTSVPEPGALSLIGAGLVLLGIMRRRVRTRD
jgi:hypothetical protein